MSTMQRWEYCEVGTAGKTTYYGGAEGYRVEEPPAPTTNDDATRAARVAQLGTQGWELVAVVRHIDEAKRPGTTLYLKRPLEDAPAEENGHAEALVEEPMAEALEEMPVIAVAEGEPSL